MTAQTKLSDALPKNMQGGSILSANRSTTASLKRLMRAKRIVAGKRPRDVAAALNSRMETEPEFENHVRSYHPTKGFRIRVL